VKAEWRRHPVAKIEKLERIFLVWPDANGVYRVRADLVSHEVARAREDALLDALRIVLRDANKSDYVARMNAYEKARELIREIEATR
jgi:hypothetical protein